ncbi:beta-induced protein ig-h3 [Seminavis robusta]|uniref:Beta-induced protein ig-h3 n=1 Tax=Seminavis robusta TaxID=568900 RepID=A0A9N8HGN8_9STRA|nr:beta-induced protein ig-h3 [Seminavis robusta]|eukprot:Sro406_g136460.1 beta-induced protein ig-h3 (210) ;mRNA; r:52049-52787
MKTGFPPPRLVLVVSVALLSLFVSTASARTVRKRKLDRDYDRTDNSRDSEDRFFPVTPAGASVPVTPPVPETIDVVERMIRKGGFQTLIKLLFTADLVDTLKGPGPFTVFAPTNRALPSGQALEDFVVSEPLSELRNVLAYHVVPGIIRSSDLVDGARLMTVQGTEIVVSIDSTGARVNTANILSGGMRDIQADNGIIHGIDGLLMVYN